MTKKKPTKPKRVKAEILCARKFKGKEFVAFIDSYKNAKGMWIKERPSCGCWVTVIPFQIRRKKRKS